MQTQRENPGGTTSSRSSWRRLVLGVFGLILGCASTDGTEIRSARLQGDGVRLDLVSDWDRRYRIEASDELTMWRTLRITEPAQGPSLVAGIPITGSTFGFFRVSLFEWEELHAEWLLGRERWRASGVTTYQFECRWTCNCPFWGWVRVQVRNDVVTDLVGVDSGEPLPKDQWGMYRTIEGWFDWIESQRSLHPVQLSAVFDRTLGYPRSGSVDVSLRIADEESGFEVRNLTF